MDWLDGELVAGVPVHEYQRVAVAGRRERIELVPELIIGERTGDARYSFGEAAPTVALDDAGRIFVYDAGNYRVAVFDPAGEFLYEFGSRGPGPSEFAWAARRKIGFIGEYLFVFVGYRRLGLWAPEGDFIEGSIHRLDDRQIRPLNDDTFMSKNLLIATPSSPRDFLFARFELTVDGLVETQRYALVPAWLQPQFAATFEGDLYVSALTERVTEIVAFAPESTVGWISRFRHPAGARALPSSLLLDGHGRIYVLPWLNRLDDRGARRARHRRTFAGW